MASKIYEYAKSMNAVTNKDSKDIWISMIYTSDSVRMPIIAKGNIFQGITAQW